MSVCAAPPTDNSARKAAAPLKAASARKCQITDRQQAVPPCLAVQTIALGKDAVGAAAHATGDEAAIAALEQHDAHAGLVQIRQHGLAVVVEDLRERRAVAAAAGGAQYKMRG